VIRTRALLASALGLAAATALAARYAGRRPPRNRSRRWAVPAQAAALAPAAAVGGVAAVALGATVAWWLAALLALPAAALAATQLPRQRRARSGPAEPAGPGAPLRLLTLNALGGRADAALMVTAVREHRVDVLAVQELTGELVSRLDAAGLADLLPFAHVDPRHGSAGTGLWSRWPLAAAADVPGLTHASPMARVTPPGAQPVTVCAIHTAAPIYRRHCDWHGDLRALCLFRAAWPGPLVIAGDFNASRDHRQFRDLLAAGLADSADIARDRPWPGFTWPANRRYPPLMRLDHVLVSPGITVSQTRTVAIAGTDHRGVLAVLGLAR
jgi:endonuclease/exonuclease/phosphatase (EEP) superfamily protein YafD